MTAAADIIVIGGGIAGLSLGYELSASVSVLVLEAESHVATHSTGRSAATYSTTYGPDAIQALSRASRAAFDGDAAPFESSMLEPCGFLYIADAARKYRLDELRREQGSAGALQPLDEPSVRALVPVLREGAVVGGLLEPDACAIDVHGVTQAYLRRLKARGSTLICDARVRHIARASSGWVVETASDRYFGTHLVNAAGAWADQVARMAGLASDLFKPCRRTAVLADVGEYSPVARPLVINVDEQFYFRPENGRVFISPCDETISLPCDSQPEEIDIATAIAHLEDTTTLCVRRIQARWAGLRTFAPDRKPVIGPDPREPHYHWLAGLGGYGIQSAPALARATACAILGKALPTDLVAEGVSVDALSLSRFAGDPALRTDEGV